MPSTIDTEETLIEIRHLPTYETPEPVLILQPGLVGKIAAALKRMAISRKDRSYQNMAYHVPVEASVNILAREHPYTYIEALIW